jgi:hypothetical protein
MRGGSLRWYVDQLANGSRRGRRQCEREGENVYIYGVYGVSRVMLSRCLREIIQIPSAKESIY